ncbi:outer membrane protein assembly factor BamE [Flavobacterium sp.]|uniref:outer membrane protein assembly factor BamE domain-containing protein n=1 Tax=Flavobacterium sp. TaxID=239 RepID=UPI0035B0F616
MKQIFILLTSLTLLSCGSYKYGANAEPTQKSNLTFGVVKSKIQKGVTTQEEILQIFGSPNLTTKNKSNNEVWSYNKMSVQEKAGRTDFFMGQKASASSSSQSFDLIITFDDNDVVKDYSVISSSF